MVKRDYTVPAVARALDILEYVSVHESPAIPDIVRDLNLPKTTVYQIIKTLQDRGYLKETRLPGGYTLGLRLFGLGNQALGQIDIRAEAMPLLYELMRSVQQTCHLGVLEGNEAVYLAKVDSPRSVAVNSWVGKRFNLQTTAMGKVLLAWRPLRDVRTLLLSNPVTSPTPYTITDIDEYIHRLEEVRQNHWAMDDRENVIQTRCMAAPVFGAKGSVIGAVSISAAADEMAGERIQEYSVKLLDTVRRLSEQIGYVGPPPSRRPGPG